MINRRAVVAGSIASLALPGLARAHGTSPCP